jgi:hypothetical protein
MDANRDLIEVLNDLIRINHDRTEGYHKAVEELKPTDIDLKTMFTNMANTSVQYANALSTEVRNLGGTPASDSTQSGTLSQALVPATVSQYWHCASLAKTPRSRLTTLRWNRTRLCRTRSDKLSPNNAVRFKSHMTQSRGIATCMRLSLKSSSN